jgi:hypothetical protein
MTLSMRLVANLGWDQIETKRDATDLNKLASDIYFILASIPYYRPVENLWQPVSYSLGLTPSGFCLFGLANHCLQGLVFVSHEEFLAAVREIVAVMPDKTLERMFEDWIQRLE